MQPAYERMKAAYARTAAFMQGRMQPACSLHASLVWTRHKKKKSPAYVAFSDLNTSYRISQTSTTSYNWHLSGFHASSMLY